MRASRRWLTGFCITTFIAFGCFADKLAIRLPKADVAGAKMSGTVPSARGLHTVCLHRSCEPHGGMVRDAKRPCEIETVKLKRIVTDRTPDLSGLPGCTGRAISIG